jgi:hypothetical protein
LAKHIETSRRSIRKQPNTLKIALASPQTVISQKEQAREVNVRQRAFPQKKECRLRWKDHSVQTERRTPDLHCPELKPGQLRHPDRFSSKTFRAPLFTPAAHLGRFFNPLEMQRRT